MCELKSFADFDRLIEARKAEFYAKNVNCNYMSGAGLDWLSPREREVHHQIRLSMPSTAEDMAAARERIQARLAARKTRKNEVDSKNAGMA